MTSRIRRFILIAGGLLATCMASGSAQAQNPVIGGVLGGGTGALVGQSVGGRNGAIIGGALGAAAGVAIASDYRGGAGYYAPQPYYPPPPVYYPPHRVYYPPQPVYFYAQPRVFHSPPVHYQRYGGGGGHRWGHHRHGHDKGHKGYRRDRDD